MTNVYAANSNSCLLCTTATARPFPHRAKPEHTLDLSRYLNDHIAQIVAEDPKHFIGLGTIPMQAPDLAVQELRRCMGELGLRGVQIGSHVNEWNLDARELDPVWRVRRGWRKRLSIITIHCCNHVLGLAQAAEELGAAIFVHPW